MSAYVHPPWLDEQRRQERPTEILVPLVEGIGPMWLHQEQRGCWYAYVASAVRFPYWEASSDGIVAECSHNHETQDDAWACTTELARQVAEQVMSSRG